jgi:NAD(P)-dependent dehydrogenase (short-subunit alcohol dehydrogenase family)
MQTARTAQRVSLVTGTSSGFGWHIALELARRGDRVYAGMRSPDTRNREPSERLASVAKEEDLQLSVLPTDVTSEESVGAAVARIVDEAGQVDALVNNVGVNLHGPWELTTIEQGRQLFETNFFGTVHCSRAVIPQMRRQGGGWIVNIGSEAGLFPIPFEGYYTSSKFALAGLSQTMRFELAQFGIRVVYLVPGACLDTRIGDNSINLTPAVAREEGPYQELAVHMTEQWKKWVTTVTGDELAKKVAEILDDDYPPPHVHAGADERRIQPRSWIEAEADIQQSLELQRFMRPREAAPTT